VVLYNRFFVTGFLQTDNWQTKLVSTEGFEKQSGFNQLVGTALQVKLG
jgi:hypothetical protein